MFLFAMQMETEGTTAITTFFVRHIDTRNVHGGYRLIVVSLPSRADALFTVWTECWLDC